MAAQTWSANALAREASKVAGRPVTDKQVRGVARDVLARFDKAKHPAYQAHAYSAAERRTILSVFETRAGRRSSQSKARTQTRKAQRRTKVAAQTPEVTPDA